MPTIHHDAAPKLERGSKIAVIGSGISGLSAAWLLSKHFDVTVIEGEDRLGGHSNTVMASLPEGELAVDTGFIVFNERTYPNLCALFQHLNVRSAASDMSFAVSAGGGALEYAGGRLGALFGQRRNLLRPTFFAMIRDILRFNKEAAIDGAADSAQTLTLGDYLDQNRYGRMFCQQHIMPMAAAIWSTPQTDIRAFPLAAFVRFFSHHGLLSLKDRPAWRTVEGGSRAYVAALAADSAAKMVTERKVTAVRREADSGVTVIDAAGGTERFQAVLIAAPADRALQMLASPTAAEMSLLSAFRYSRNRAVLHADRRLMPKRRAVWSSWNVLQNGGEASGSDLCVTYWMNQLQPLATEQELFVTLNPTAEPEQIYYECDYYHPVFDTDAMLAQRRLWQLQGAGNIWYAGAHFGYGFHEDGLQSGLAAAESMGPVTRPWAVQGASDRVLALQPGSDSTLEAAV